MSDRSPHLAPTVPLIKTAARRTVAPIARRGTRRWARILMYHRFGPEEPGRRIKTETLDRQLAFLRRHFNVVPLGSIVAKLIAREPFEPGSVAVTVDDAYTDFAEHAYPVFLRHGVPVTLYVISEFANGRLWLWWDAIQYCVAAAANGRYLLSFNGRPIELLLSDDTSRHNAWRRLAAIGGYIGPVERDKFILEVERAVSVPLPSVPPPQFGALTWEQLRALDTQLVEIGAHTRTHPILARCNSDSLRDEIAGSKNAIEAQLERRVCSFCYPNGEWPYVDSRAVQTVKAAGFESGVMACGELVRPWANRFALARMSVSTDQFEFESDVAGVAYLWHLLVGQNGLPADEDAPHC